MRKDNAVRDKSFSFAVRIVKLYQYLVEQKKEFVLSKQLLRSGTSVGAMIREAEHAESKNDFSHKLAIAQKEINDSIYWLDLLKETNYLTISEYENILHDAVEIIKLITAIIKSTKSNQIKPH
jgi:four helix bundle protein